jgi:hypothetical protein
MSRTGLILLVLLLLALDGLAQHDRICGVRQLMLGDSLFSTAESLADSAKYDSAATLFSKASRIYDKERFTLRYVRSRRRAGSPNIYSITDSSFKIHKSTFQFASKNLTKKSIEENQELSYCSYYHARNLRLINQYDSSFFYSNLGLNLLKGKNDKLSRKVKYFHYKNLGNTYQDIGNLIDAIFYNRYASKFLDDQQFVDWANIISNIGYLYSYEENYDYAITYFSKHFSAKSG